MWDEDVQDREELKLISNYVQQKIVCPHVEK